MIQRRGGRRAEPNEATPAQRRNLRRLFGRYVRDVRAPGDGEDGDAFAEPLDAVAYALARWMLSDRGRLPRSKTGAHDWIDALSQPEDREQGVLRIFVLARRAGQPYSAWKTGALRPLETLYGYPHEAGWLGRLNAAIAERHAAEEDAGERERRERQAWAFRAHVVDPCIRLPEDEGHGGGGNADGEGGAT